MTIPLILQFLKEGKKAILQNKFVTIMPLLVYTVHYRKDVLL